MDRKEKIKMIAALGVVLIMWVVMAAGDSETVRNCPEVSEESEKVAQSNSNTKKELPAPVKNALLGYIDMLESDIMDIAEAIAERTEKMNELKKTAKAVKDYIRENEHD